MIDAVTFETAHCLGDILPALLRLRFRMFVERNRYNVPHLRKMEWDAFDTPAAVYFAWRDETGKPRAAARLIPTTFPYMIKELWPDMVDSGTLPEGADTWEISRLGVDRGLTAAERHRILGELMCASGEFAALFGVTSYLLVTHPQVIQNTVLACGNEADVLGRSSSLGRFPVVAARTPATADALDRVRRHYGITGSVLRIAGSDAALAA